MHRTSALRRATVAFLTLISALGASRAAAEEPERTSEPPRQEESLLEEDFTALGLFQGIRMLRPQIRLSQSATANMPSTWSTKPSPH